MSLLRARGGDAAAEVLRTGQLEDALAAFRTTGVSEAEIATRLETILAAEEDRVANAIILADVLAPILAEQLGSRMESLATAAAHTPPTAKAGAALPPSKRNDTPLPPAGIADFIDQMIALERPAPQPPPQRRAS
jgi:hypothetical protein